MARSEHTESTKLIDQIINEIEQRLIREEELKLKLAELDGQLQDLKDEERGFYYDPKNLSINVTNA
jgi:hypothetical protein